MKQQVAAGYQRARNKANQRRESPSRKEMALRTAIKRLGYEVIGYEFEVHDTETGRSYWYDVAYRYGLRDHYLDLTPRWNYNERRVLDRKLHYCRKWDIPYLVVKPGSVAEMQSQIIQAHKLRRWTT